MRARIAIAALVVALATTLTACVADAAAVIDKQPPASTSASTPAPSETPEPTSDAAAQDPDDPSTWIVDGGGIGPLRLWAPFDPAAPELGPGPYVTDLSRCPNPAVATLAAEGFGLTVVTADDLTTIDLVQVGAWGMSGEGAPATAEGVTVGMTIAELEAAYPGIQPSGMSNNSTVYALEDGDGWIVFWTMDDEIIVMASSPDATIPSELCG